MTPKNRWEDADRICDGIVAMMNEEVRKNTRPLQILCGLTLGIISFMQTGPTSNRPVMFQIVLGHLGAMLSSIRASAEAQKN